MPLRILQLVFAFHFVAGGELGAGALGTEARSMILPPAEAPLVLGSMIENGPLYPREPRLLQAPPVSPQANKGNPGYGLPTPPR